MSGKHASKYAWIRLGASFTTLIAALISTAVAVFKMWLETRDDASTRCLLDSTFPGTVISVDVNVEAAYATVFPAGRYCLWKAYDGTIAVEQTGWVATWVALGFLVLALAAVLVLVGTEWWIPAVVLMVIILGGWVTIWAMSDTFLSPVFWPDLPPSQLPPRG